MNSQNDNSASDSTGPAVIEPPPPEKLNSELLYVQEQAANAKAAFKQTLGEIGHGLREGVSIREWTQTHPWVMVSSAAVAGFAAGCAAIPSKDEKLIDKLKEFTESFRPSHKSDKRNHDKDGDHNGDHDGHDDRKPHKSFIASIAGDLIRAAIPAISTIISAAVKQPAPPETASTSDGSPPNPSA